MAGDTIFREGLLPGLRLSQKACLPACWVCPDCLSTGLTDIPLTSTVTHRPLASMSRFRKNSHMFRRCRGSNVAAGECVPMSQAGPHTSGH